MAQESTHELQFSDSQTFFYCEILVYRCSFANKAFHGTLLYKYGFLWLQIINTVAKCGVHKVMADVRVAMFTFTPFSELNRWMVCLSVEWSSSEFTIALQQQQLEVVNDFMISHCGVISMLVLLELSAAFNIVNHNILLQRVEHTLVLMEVHCNCLTHICLIGFDLFR